MMRHAQANLVRHASKASTHVKLYFILSCLDKIDTKKTGEIIMSNKNVVPEAKDALNKFKMQAASEVGVNLKNGYNGDLTSKQAGSVGGQMVNNMTPVRTMRFERHNRISQGHKITVKYAYSLTV